MNGPFFFFCLSSSFSSSWNEWTNDATFLNYDENYNILDFAENYSFLVQDAAQGFHWYNLQATIHSFIIYYVDRSGKLVHKSYACVSDHKTHDTIMVYSFLKHVYD